MLCKCCCCRKRFIIHQVLQQTQEEARSHQLSCGMIRTSLFAAYFKSRESTFWLEVFVPNLKTHSCGLPGSSPITVLLLPAAVRSGMLCRWNGAESNHLQLLSQPNICSPKQHSRRALHPQLHNNTQGQRGRKGKLFLRHLHLVLIARVPFGCVGGIHTFVVGKKVAQAPY